MNRTTNAALAVTTAALALAGCSAGDSTTDTADTKPSAPAAAMSSAAQAAGIPAEPTGAKRQQLLDALRKAAPDVIRYEDKAVDAARNQCSAINGGAQRLDSSAALRFTYEDVTTSEAQGKAINEALKSSGFCKV